jgi:VWFA-related protein
MRGRSPAKVQDYRQRSKSIQEQAMGELADGTGGTFFHNNNNPDAGFKAITQAPEVVYMLELPLDGVKANDSYHPLKVKVDREGTTVQTRRGYLMPKEEKSKK